MRTIPFTTVSGSLGGAGLLLALTAPLAFALTFYQVHVLTKSAEDLAQVQTQVPDAYWVQGEDQIFILAGTFMNRNHAQRRQSELERLGFQVRIVSRQDTDPPLPPAKVDLPTPAASTSQAETLPPASPPSPSAQRPFVTQVPNPNRDPRLEEQVRRFFPGATVVEYQGQPALRTGEFSRLSLAQDQARWLNARGLPAVAVAKQEAESQPVADVPQGEKYWVLVADPTGEKLPALEKFMPGSLPLIYDDLRVVRTGGFSHMQAAEEQVRYLAQHGYEAGIFPADLRRSQPLLQQNPIPSSAPSATSPAQSFWVVVEGGEEILPQLQQYAPDAFVRGSVIQVGTYRQRANAEQAQRSLSEAGFKARVVVAEP